MIEFDLRSGGKLVFIHPGSWMLIGTNEGQLELRGEAILDDEGEPDGECYFFSMLADADLARIGHSRESLREDLKHIAALADEQVEFQ